MYRDMQLAHRLFWSRLTGKGLNQTSLLLVVIFIIGVTFSLTLLGCGSGSGSPLVSTGPTPTPTPAPALLDISPQQVTVGSILSVTIAGGDAGAPANNVISFLQAGQTIAVPASSATAGANSGTIVATVTVPSGLLPATAESDLSAPATVTASVDGVAAKGAQSLSVLPPPHAIGISPPSAQVGTSVRVALAGAFTGFGSSSGITSDDSGLSISEISVLSPSLITATLTLASTLSAGNHVLTVSSGGATVPFGFTVMAASSVPVFLTSLSQTSLLPLAPVTLTGSGFTGGGQTNSSLVLRYTYAGAVAEIEVTPDSDTEIETFVPLLGDVSNGSLYVGTVSIQAVVSGKPSGSQNFSISALPPNTGPIGATTTAFLAAVGSQLSMLTNEFPQSPGLSSDQMSAFGSLVNVSQTNFQSVSNLIASAASGNVVTAPDGSTFTAATVDLVDRLLQSSNIMTLLAASELRSVKDHSNLDVGPQSASNTEMALASLGQICTNLAALNKIANLYLNIFAFTACGAALIPPLAPIAGPLCGAALSIKEEGWLYETVGEFVCDAMPINLTSVAANPASLAFPPGGSPIVEMPIGNFSQSPTIAGQILGQILMKYLKQSTQIFRVILQNKTFANYVGSILQFAFDQLWKQFLKSSAPGVIASIPVQLTPDLAPLGPNPNSLVSITGYTVSPLPTAAGALTLNFDLTQFRLLDSKGDPAKNLGLPGNSIPVTVGTVTSPTLYSFCSLANCADGFEPEFGALFLDGAGNVYGTTTFGGANRSGTVFKVNSTGQESVLYSFCSTANCADGLGPSGGLIQDAGGNFYGTTQFGGANGGGASLSSGGTVFKLDNAGHETVLANFCSAPNCADGDVPFAGLIRDAAGNLYGTAQFGGANGSGAVFLVDNAGQEIVLYSFCPKALCLDGDLPNGGLVRDAGGNLYGTTMFGGTNNTVTGSNDGGTLFRVDILGNETVLYSFCSLANCLDGQEPTGKLIQDTSGSFYGTTAGGGANGGGTVFRINSAGQLTVLYSFCSLVNCADGQQPTGGVIQDGGGNLYGTTILGGTNGHGTVFKIDNAGHETVLYSFCSLANCADGFQPEGPLIQDSAGNLYGTTAGGGSGNFRFGVAFAGTVFKLPTKSSN